jgi:flagellar hook-associated protein 3 FlgL
MSGWGTIHDKMMFGLRTHAQTLASLQEQVASGSRILRASDEPTATHQIMSLQSQSESLSAYDGNIDRVVGNLTQADTVLQQMSTLMIKAEELISQASSDTLAPQRATIGNAINELLAQAVWLANTEVLGQKLFSGNDTKTEPYAIEETGGKITSVTYQGSMHTSSIPVAPGVEQPGGMVGERVFGSNDRQPPVFFGQTGAVSGSGTSSVRGDVWLEVTHDTTTFAGATGVAAGTDSADEDTIVGTSHTLTIDADTNMLQLDGGVSVPYGVGGDDANVMVINSDGDKVYVDVTNLAGGLAGSTDVAITATAKMSIDDFASTVDVTAFGANEAITDSDTGRVLFVDATGIERVGVEPVRLPGTGNIFDMLISARDVLLNDQGMTREQQTELLNDSIFDSFDEVSSSMRSQMAAVGGRLQAMSNLKISIADIKFGVDNRRADLQDADIIEIATELARTQAFYEMILAASAKVLKVSLLDYL